jgi:hypothetical protein
MITFPEKMKGALWVAFEERSVHADTIREYLKWKRVDRTFALRGKSGAGRASSSEEGGKSGVRRSVGAPAPSPGKERREKVAGASRSGV